MSSLYGLVEKQNFKATAIVGLTKNVGKTVTFNYLVNKFDQSKIVLGLISSGYDGERFDRLTLEEKPRIFAPKGAYLATAEACFDTAEADLQLMEKSSVFTPLGSVCLGLVKEAGMVELAGPGSVKGLRLLIDKMLGYGAEQVLVDGAINRLASASPSVSGGTILATGASLGPTMEDVVKKTSFRQQLLTTPTVENSLVRDLAQNGLKKGNAVILHRKGESYEVEILKEEIPLLAGEKLIDKSRPETAALVFGGALVDNFLQDIMDLFSDVPDVLVQDASRLFISPEIYYRYLNQGGQFYVLNRINLLAVTLNPTDPSGKSYDPKMFIERMREALNPCPVFDLEYEKNLIEI
ncbi:MAG: hypothetical protein R6U91_01660 [Bacillota bacterium]